MNTEPNLAGLYLLCFVHVYVRSEACFQASAFSLSTYIYSPTGLRWISGLQTFLQALLPSQPSH